MADRLETAPVTIAATEGQADGSLGRRGLGIYVRAAIGVFAALVFAVALARFLSPDAVRPVHYWWLMMVGPALTIVGLTAGTVWQRAGLVAASLLLGFAAQLAFKEPIWFQHLRIRLSSPLAYAMVAALALQVLWATICLWRRGALADLVRVGSRLGWARVLILGLLLAAGTVGAIDLIGDHNYRSLANQLIIATGFLAANILSFAALIVTLPAEELRRASDRVTRLISLPGSKAAGRLDGRFPWCVALAVFAFSIFARLAVFENIPRIDEVIYLFQAECYAQGRIVLPMPPSTAAFDIYMMNSYGGHWFATASPGWPLVLAIGVFFGATWIVNPLLAAISVLLVHSFVTIAQDRKFANLVIILLAVSPWFLWTSSTLMTHNVTLAALVGAWLLMMKARLRPSVLLPFAAGALMGLIFLTRPLDGFVCGVLTGLWALTFLRTPGGLRTVLLYAAGCLVVGALAFLLNLYLTGNAMLPPMNAYFDKLWGPGANRLGFGPDIGAKPAWGKLDPFPGHSPLEALIEAQQMFYSLSADLLGWAVGSAAFALIFLLWGRWSKLTVAMAVVAGATIAAQTLYWFAAFDYIGPRYWFMLLLPVLVLTAAGIVTCARRFESLFPQGLVSYRIGAGVGFLCLCSLVVSSSWLALNKYPGFRGYHADYRELAHQARFRRALVFISMDNPTEYENAFWLNDFDPQSDRTVFARDLGNEINRRVAASYPGRPIYFVNGRTQDPARRRVAVARGPLSLGDLGSAR